MKARIIETGEVIEISEDYSHLCAENCDKFYNFNELELLDIKEKSLSKDEPDYWEKLKHQYAGMAMQGVLANPKDETSISIAIKATTIASTLIDKLKEEPNEGKALLYAVNKTAERTKKEVINKVINWLGENLHNYAYNVSYLSLYKDLKQAMQDESKLL